MKHQNRFAFLSAYLTFFVDNLCWSIVFPIFAPYFLSPNNPLFSSSLSLSDRTILLGLFLMAFSLGQFVAAPILGEYADRYGRRKVLIVSIFFTFIGLLITAWSMQFEYLALLFFGRLVTGVFSSNGSICLACVSDLSLTETAKLKNFGYFSILAGFSFVVGAFIGGKLADPTVNSFFSPQLPIWLASGVTLLNFLFVLFAFKEVMHRGPPKHLSAFQNLKTALKTKRLFRIYIVYFLFIFSWTILLQFTPVIVIQKFDFTSSNIGDLALFVGVCWAMGSGYLKGWLLKLFSPNLILKWSLFLLAFLSAYLILPKEIYGILGLMGASVILGGMTWPLCVATISNLAPDQMQGKILGISQSIQSLAMAIAPVAAGIAFKSSDLLPFLLGAASFFLAAIFCFKKFSNKGNIINHREHRGRTD